MTRRIQSAKGFGMTCILAIATFNMTVSNAREAQAKLVSADFKTPGDGLLTRDTRTGLEWLDLSQTADLTYAAVASGAKGLTKKERFRVAVRSQVDGLFKSAREEVGTFPVYATIYGDAVAVDRLQTLMGYRSCGGGAVASGINSKSCSGQAYFGKPNGKGELEMIRYYYYQVSGTPRQSSPTPPQPIFSASGDLSFAPLTVPKTTPDNPVLLVRRYRR